MMWIEVVSRDGHVYARERIAGDEARIGRAFDNDVVVDDPHVAPHHLRIVRDADGELVAEDLGTLNGLYREHGDERLPRLPLAREPGMRIGRTIVRVHDANHPVAPEKLLAPPRAHTRWALLLAAALLALSTLLNWLSTTTELTATRLMLPTLGMAVFIAMWAGFWGVLSRIFSGQAHFAAMLRIAITAALALTLWDFVADWLAFGLAWRDMRELRDIGSWALLAPTCYAHLRVIGPRRIAPAMGLVVALLVTAVALQYVGRSEARKTIGQSATLGPLKPPAMRLVPASPPEEFLRGAEEVKRRVDEARKREPTTGMLQFDVD